MMISHLLGHLLTPRCLFTSHHRWPRMWRHLRTTILWYYELVPTFHKLSLNFNFWRLRGNCKTLFQQAFSAFFVLITLVYANQYNNLAKHNIKHCHIISHLNMHRLVLYNKRLGASLYHIFFTLLLWQCWKILGKKDKLVSFH